MRSSGSAILLVSLTACASAPNARPLRLVELPSPTRASLRGVCAVSRHIAWASGANGTCLRTVDGGTTWLACRIASAADRDLRDVHAFDSTTAVALAVGSPALIFRTEDGGSTWREVFRDAHPSAFLDGLDFADSANGYAFGDPIDGAFMVLATRDGGRSWQRLPGAPTPQPGEAAFAASGTCLDARSGDVAIVTGGAAVARVLRHTDAGWSTATTPLRAGDPARGAFSLARLSAHWIAVGGDYRAPHDAHANLAVSHDDGASWHAPTGTPPNGFRSCVRFIPTTTLALTCGESGIDLSRDFGTTWEPLATVPLHALSFARDGTGYGSGPSGRLVRIEFE